MVKWQEPIEKNDLDTETLLWKLYQEGIDYQESLGLRTNIPKFIDFYEGRQWPSPTEATKNLPRPVVNIVKMICRSKKAMILSTPVKILYKSYSPKTDTQKFNDFATSILKELGQEQLDRQAIDDGIKKGSYFFHYYWDKNATDLSGKREGGVRCELIDPLNIFFSNPSELDEQKQQWILISTRLSPEEIALMADEKIDITQILSDEGYDSQSKGQCKVTLLTRYFKKDGEIWCERATKGQIINKPFSLTPCKLQVRELLESHNETVNTKSEESTEATEHKELTSEGELLKLINGRLKEEKYKKPSTLATLFPIVSGYYERREGSIYGLSEVEGIIPNQKSINFNIAMSLLNTQQCAWGKYVALPNALKGQKITNSPGQVLIDYSNTGDGIKKMEESSLSQVPMDITSTLTDLTRTTTGASQIMSGEAFTANMSGAAIAQLQAQAQLPIEELRATFYNVKRKQGYVLAQFLKLYYYDREFIKRTLDENGNESEECDHFYSSAYENSIFEVIVESIGGSKATVASDITMLDNCLKNGNISLKTYIKAYPESALTNKQEILRQIEAEEQSEIALLKEELKKYKNPKILDPVSIV